MEKSEIDALKTETRRLQSSLNYWNNAAQAHREKNREKAAAHCEARAEKQATELAKLRAKLYDDDPERSITRQLNNAYSTLAHTTKELAQLDSIATMHQRQNAGTKDYWQAQLTKKQKKITQIQQRIHELKTQKHALNEPAQELRTMSAAEKATLTAATNKAYSYDLDAEEAMQLALHEKKKTTMQ